MYIIVFNTASEDKRERLEENLRRGFPHGASIKQGVYLISKKGGVNFQRIVEVVYSTMTPGDSVYINELKENGVCFGYPLRFKDWLNRHKDE